MSSADMDRRLAEMEATYPALFQSFRGVGWSEAWRADAGQLAGEPHFDHPYSMHDLARALLERFGGVHVVGRGWRGVYFGCRHMGTSTSLRIVRPYEVEEYLLGERSETKTRPPAFPIGRMNDQVMFMREDWSTITVGYNWGWVILTDDPFQMIHAEMTRDRSIVRDPKRCWSILDMAQVPERFENTIYRCI